MESLGEATKFIIRDEMSVIETTSPTDLGKACALREDASLIEISSIPVFEILIRRLDESETLSDSDPLSTCWELLSAPSARERLSEELRPVVPPFIALSETE
jgi:hypothetical protein